MAAYDCSYVDSRQAKRITSSDPRVPKCDRKTSVLVYIHRIQPEDVCPFVDQWLFVDETRTTINGHVWANVPHPKTTKKVLKEESEHV